MPHRFPDHIEPDVPKTFEEDSAAAWHAIGLYDRMKAVADVADEVSVLVSNDTGVSYIVDEGNRNAFCYLFG